MTKLLEVSVLAACTGLTVLAVEGLASRAVEAFEQIQLPSSQQFIDGLASYPHIAAFESGSVQVVASHDLTEWMPAEAELFGPASLAD